VETRVQERMTEAFERWNGAPAQAPSSPS